MQVIACMRALVNALLMNGLFTSMHTLEDIPAEFFGGALPAKKQQKQMDAADAPSPGSASSNDHMPLPPKQRRLPNLFPTLPALHKFIERYVTTSGLIMRDGTQQAFGPRDEVLAALQKAQQPASVAAPEKNTITAPSAA